MSRSRLLATLFLATALVALGFPSISGPEASYAAGRQSGFMTLLPQIVQAGRRPAPSARANYLMKATFRPARPGRPVLFQRQRGASYVTVYKTREDASGVATYTGTHTPGFYRAVAARWHGEPAHYTSLPASTATWAVPGFDSEFSDRVPTGILPPGWGYRAEGTYDPASLRKCSKSDPRAVQMVGGTMQLSVKIDPSRRGEKCHTKANGRRYTFPYYINAHVGTDAGYSFIHGIAAARVKFPKQKGEHGSFWMQGGRSEVDTVEYFGAPRRTSVHGDESRNIYQFIHYTAPSGRDTSFGGFQRNTARLLSRNEQWYNRYHVFSVAWDAHKYVFMVDGVKTFQTTRGASSDPHVLILSLLTSDWELPQMSNSALPTHMNVDWVKVWPTESS